MSLRDHDGARRTTARRTASPVRRVLRDLLLPVAVALMLAFVVQAVAAKPYDIPTGSMAPTIQPHDRIIANRFIYRLRDIHRGDIIVFSPTSSAKRTCQETLDGPWVKRVIGLPGDRVRVVAAGPTLVNGTPLSIPNARPNPVSMSWPAVPAGQLLVLGDNRPNSCDAHLWKPDAFVPESSVIGQAEVIYWPPQHIGFLN